MKAQIGMTDAEIYECLDLKAGWYCVSTTRIKHRKYSFRTLDEALGYISERIVKNKGDRDLIVLKRSNQVGYGSIPDGCLLWFDGRLPVDDGVVLQGAK